MGARCRLRRRLLLVLALPLTDEAGFALAFLWIGLALVAVAQRRARLRGDEPLHPRRRQDVTFAAAAFTLSWTHSVEKTRWEEDWQITPAGLEIVEARVKGSGAGMEPPEDAVLKNGWWVYAPKFRRRPEIVLAASGATGRGWSLCARGRMHGDRRGRRRAGVVIEPCGGEDQ